MPASGGFDRASQHMVRGLGAFSPRIPSGWRAGSICMRMRATIRLRLMTRTGCARSVPQQGP